MSRRILAVATNHDRYDRSDDRTGLWLGELTHFEEVISASGFEMDLVSPRGGPVPVDQRSLRRDAGATRANRRFLSAGGRARLECSRPPEEVSGEDYEAIYFAGGHGAMWDFRDSPELQGLAEAMERRGAVIAAVCHGVAALLDHQTKEGVPMVAGRPVTGYAKVEEQAVRRRGNVPYSLQDELVRRGGLYRKAAIPFAPHVEVAGRLVTGQNPFSAKGVARAVVELLGPPSPS